MVNISDYQSSRRVAESLADPRLDGGSAGPAYAGVAAPNGNGSRRRLILQLLRTADNQADVEQINRIGVVLHEYAGGTDQVELILSGASRPRVELEWPSLKIRWDRQLQRKLESVLGQDSVRIESIDEAEKAVAP